MHLLFTIYKKICLCDSTCYIIKEFQINFYQSSKDKPITTRTKLMNTKPIEKPFSFLLFNRRTTKDNPNSISPNMVMPFIVY